MINFNFIVFAQAYSEWAFSGLLTDGKKGGGAKKPLSSADINIFPPEISKFAISKNTDIDCIFINNF